MSGRKRSGPVVVSRARPVQHSKHSLPVPESTSSLLIDLVATFSSVFVAQYLSNVVHDRRENQARRHRLDKLREMISYDLQLALPAVGTARRVLLKDGRAPEVRVSPGALASRSFDILDMCAGDAVRVAKFTVAVEHIKLLNKRLDKIEEMDAQAQMQINARTSNPAEHKAQCAEAVKRSVVLQRTLEELLIFVDQKAAEEWTTVAGLFALPLADGSVGRTGSAPEASRQHPSEGRSAP